MKQITSVNAIKTTLEQTASLKRVPTAVKEMVNANQMANANVKTASQDLTVLRV